MLRRSRSTKQKQMSRKKYRKRKIARENNCEFVRKLSLLLLQTGPELYAAVGRLFMAF